MEAGHFAMYRVGIQGAKASILSHQSTYFLMRVINLGRLSLPNWNLIIVNTAANSEKNTSLPQVIDRSNVSSKERGGGRMPKFAELCASSKGGGVMFIFSISVVGHALKIKRETTKP
jgi:hypothetical protein